MPVKRLGLSAEGRFDVTMKRIFAATSLGSQSRLDSLTVTRDRMSNMERL